jgi:hypothetical protein
MRPNFRFPNAWFSLGLHQTTQYLKAGHDTNTDNKREFKKRKVEKTGKVSLEKKRYQRKKKVLE